MIRHPTTFLALVFVGAWVVVVMGRQGIRIVRIGGESVFHARPSSDLPSIDLSTLLR